MVRRLKRERAKSIVEGLWARFDEVVEAVVADGWSEAMVRAGFERHQKTWDVEALADAVEQELGALDEKRYRLMWPSRVNHIWPALPGAGLTPVLVGVLLGLEQGVRPSSRGQNFGRLAARIGGWDLIEPDGSWERADVVVVSGSDETLGEVRRRVGANRKVLGYGHRLSVAMIVDGEGVDLGPLAKGVAEDVVMWKQGGCFSVRAVLFVGDPRRQEAFCRDLAREIALCEQRWEIEVGQGELAERAQLLGLAQLRGQVFSEGLGYVRIAEGPYEGTREAVLSVAVHRGAKLGDDVVLQGLSVGGAVNEKWRRVALSLGPTRICAPGRLQEPPAWWWHDGEPNALGLARVVSLR